MEPAPSSPPPWPHVASAPAALTLTGERTLPGIADERYWFERHVVAYARAAELMVGGRPGAGEHPHLGPAGARGAPPRRPGALVLDAGCGEGYGLALLRRAGASRVFGVDLDADTVAHARARYASVDPGLEVVRAELTCLPFGDDHLDATVSLQVIEHLHDTPGYLCELLRVTRPGGRVLLATPNRLTFTPDSDVPVNPFHTREFAPDELRDELAAAGLHVVRLEGVHHGACLRAFERDRGRALTAELGAGPPATWPRPVRDLVHRVGSSWFAVRDDGLDASLDLLATCTVPLR